MGREASTNKANAGKPTSSAPASPSAAAPRRVRWVLPLVVFVLALSFRGAYLWGQAHNNPIFDYPQMDGLVHHTWAKQIAAGEGMEARPYLRAPLYYYGLALLYKLFGPSVVLARCAGAVLGAISCVLIARLGQALGGTRTAWVAGLIAAFYWPFVYFDAELLTTGTEVLLDVLFMLALIGAGKSGKIKSFAGAGAVWGLSALARPNVLALAPAIWLWSWIATRGDRTKRRLACILSVTLSAAAVVLPVTLRNYFVGGEAVLISSSGGVNFFIGNNPESTGYLVNVPGARSTWNEWLADTHAIAERDAGHPLTDGEVSDYWFSRAWRWIRAQPGAWMALLGHKFRLFWSPVELPNNQPIWFLAQLAGVSALFWIGFPVVAALAAGGLATLRRGTDRSWFVPLSFGLVYMVTVVAFFCPARFRVPVAPVLIVLAARGLSEFVSSAKQHTFPRMIGYGLFVAAAGLFIATNPPERTAFRHRAMAEGNYMLGRYLATPEPDGPGDLQAAAEVYRRSVEIEPTLERRSALARTLYQLHEYAGASEQFDKMVKESPNSIAARVESAEFFTSQNNLDAAAEQYRAALLLAPGDRGISGSLNDVEYNLGAAMIAAGKTQEGLAMLQGVVVRDGANAAAWQNLGVACAKLNRIDEAIAAFRRTIKLNPAYTEASINLARALDMNDSRDEAVEVLESALAESPNDLQVVVSLARLLAMRPELDRRDGRRAMQLCEKAVSLTAQPGPDIVEIIAAAQAEIGQFDQAASMARSGMDGARAAGLNEWTMRFEHALSLYEQSERFSEPVTGEPE